MSHMRQAMEAQPAELRRLLDDFGPVERAIPKLQGRRVTIVGIGSSWHAALHGAAFMRLAGVEARVFQSPDFLATPPSLGSDDAVIVLSHTGTRQYTNGSRSLADKAGATTLLISGIGVEGADLLTVEQEESAAFTSSHTGAMLRLAQLAVALGADLGPLADVPAGVQAVLDGDGLGIEPPQRLIEFMGGGPNQYAAAEGSLKVREAAYCAAEGLSVEQFLHGPSVALGAGDVLVGLDGGGASSARLEEVAAATRQAGAHTVVARHAELGEELSVFPLTVVVQRIALELAEQLDRNPDTAALDLPGHEAFHDLTL
jgi:glucosamine--fructose-6-phosphate aminotransferase (isomerizing)